MITTDIEIVQLPAYVESLKYISAAYEAANRGSKEESNRLYLIAAELQEELFKNLELDSRMNLTFQENIILLYYLAGEYERVKLLTRYILSNPELDSDKREKLETMLRFIIVQTEKVYNGNCR